MVSVVRGVGALPHVGRLGLAGRPDRREIRRWIRGVCAARLDVHTLVDVLLVTTELVENAYRHTSCPIEARIACADFGVMVEVSDGDADHPAEMAAADRTWGGRGVQAMVELAISWGVREEGPGKTVWALLPMVVPKVTPRTPRR